MFLLYDLALIASALILIPYFSLRALRKGTGRIGLRQRLGFLSQEKLEAIRGPQVFWIHAVSVGETRAALPLGRALKKAFPECRLVVSNVTETGHAIACAAPEADLCLYFPFDLSLVVRSVFRKIRPSMVIIVETEIWPNFVRIAKQRGIPVLLANGRISDRSYPRYRMVRSLLRPILGMFAGFCMQSKEGAARIRALGAAPSKISVTGNLKFDMQASGSDPEAMTVLKAKYHLPEEHLVWVAGSTHGGEEEQVLEAFQALRQKHRDMNLVLVPRHPERCRNVCEVLARCGVPYVLRTALDTLDRPLAPGELLLVDTIGEMLPLYATADLVFVGGSLVPVGGHNILEASLMKRPVLFGPHMQNFREIAALVTKAGGGVCVNDGQGLAKEAGRLLDDPALRESMGNRGYALVEENAGATQTTIEVVRKVLESR